MSKQAQKKYLATFTLSMPEEAGATRNMIRSAMKANIDEFVDAIARELNEVVRTGTLGDDFFNVVPKAITVSRVK